MFVGKAVVNLFVSLSRGMFKCEYLDLFQGCSWSFCWWLLLKEVISAQSSEGRILFICLLQLYCTDLGSSGPWKLKMVHSKVQGQTQKFMPLLSFGSVCWRMCLLPCWKATPIPALTTNIGSQLDILQNYLGNKPLAISVMVFLGWVNRGERLHPECGQHHLMSWSPGLNQKEEGNWAPPFISLCFLTGCNVPSCLGVHCSASLPWLLIPSKLNPNHSFISFFC